MRAVFPFTAAILDLDGTLLDSLDVWKTVDRLFFEKRGMTVPADYGRALAGMSYRESAQYTLSRFHLPGTWEEIVREWMEMAGREYAENVALKPGAREYLCALRHAGVRMAVATALPETMYLPCLKRLGIDSWFQALCSTDETGGRGKSGGEVFLLAARRMGVGPADCAVFEDVPEGIQGARAAGMRAYALLDPREAYSHAELRKNADAAAEDFTAFLPYRSCCVYTGFSRRESVRPEPGELVLCADAGWEKCRAAGIPVDAVIGDFDSSEEPEPGMKILRYPVEKDDTDTLLCVRYALEEGIREIRIIGDIGGRADHTIALIQTMEFAANRGARIELRDSEASFFCFRDSVLRLPAGAGKFGVFALGGPCTGVFIRGAKYTLENGTLEPDYPVGMGNSFIGYAVEIGCASGCLLVTCQNAPESA